MVTYTFVYLNIYIHLYIYPYIYTHIYGQDFSVFVSIKTKRGIELIANLVPF
jgi:hypothetical protein